MQEEYIFIHFFILFLFLYAAKELQEESVLYFPFDLTNCVIWCGSEQIKIKITCGPGLDVV